MPRVSGRAGIAGFFLGAAGMFATMYSTQAILPELSRDFDVGAAEAGLTISVVVLSVALAGWVWGPVSDRIGRVRTMRTGQPAARPPTVGVAIAPTFGLLLVCRGAQGLCMPGLLVVGAPYVVETLIPRVGARAMGWYAAALVAGGLIGRVGVALASAVVGWRVAIGALAVLPIAAAVAMRGSLPDGAVPARSGRTARGLANPPAAGRGRRRVPRSSSPSSARSRTSPTGSRSVRSRSTPRPPASSSSSGWSGSPARSQVASRSGSAGGG